MKKIIIGLSLLGMSIGAFAQDVPRAVRDRFKKDYPRVAKMQWERVNGRWNASFNKEGNDMMACYEVNGRHIDSRIPVSQTVVPDPVIHHLRTVYPGEMAHSFTKIDRPHKRDLYKVNITQRGAPRTIYMDSHGHEQYYASR